MTDKYTKVKVDDMNKLIQVIKLMEEVIGIQNDIIIDNSYTDDAYNNIKFKIKQYKTLMNKLRLENQE